MVSKLESNPDADIKLSDLNLELESRPLHTNISNRRKSNNFYNLKRESKNVRFEFK